MESPDLWKGDDATLAGWLSRSRLRTIFPKRQMSPGSVVIIEVRGKDPTQMALVQDDHVIQAFTPDRSDNALGKCILPG
jgi:hypothetical protein